MEILNSVLKFWTGFTGSVVQLVVNSLNIAGSIPAGISLSVGNWIYNTIIHPGFVLKVGQANDVTKSINHRYEKSGLIGI